MPPKPPKPKLIKAAPAVDSAQIRAARRLLDWSRKRLSAECGVSHGAIADFETQRTSSMLTETAGKLIEAFAAHGVVFIDGDKIGGAGVRFKEAKPGAPQGLCAKQR